MTFGAESSQSGNYVTAIIGNFTLIIVTSNITLHLAGLLFVAMVFSHLTHLTIYLTLYCLCSRKIFLALGTICILSTCWRMRFIISWASLDGVKWAVNWTQPDLSLIKTLASSLVLVRIYTVDNKSSPSECHWIDDKEALSKYHWVDDKGLTPASHHYARIVARGLEVPASYVQWPNLTIITSRLVLE